jgi:hypothetical protein
MTTQKLNLSSKSNTLKNSPKNKPLFERLALNLKSIEFQDRFLKMIYFNFMTRKIKFKKFLS